MAAGALGPLRHRDFRLFFLGGSVSSFGGALTSVALAFGVLRLTHSASDLGFVLGAESLSVVAFLIIGGVVADRVSRRLAMMAADGVRCLTQAALGSLLLFAHPPVGLLMVLAAIWGAAFGFFQPARVGLIPALVAKDELQQANSLVSLASSVASVAGPALAGALVLTVGAGWAIIGDAASFLVNVVSLAFVRGSVLPPATARHHFFEEVRVGFFEVRSRDWLRSLVLVISFTNLLVSAYLVLGPYATLRLYDGAATWSTVVSVGAIGSIAGGLVAVRLRARHPLRLGVLTTLPFGLVPLAFALRLPVAALAVVSFVAWAGVVVLNTVWQTALQEQVPDEVLSRTSSYEWFATSATSPIGYAVAAPVAALIGLRHELAAIGLLILVAVALLLGVRSIREMEAGRGAADPPEAATAPPAVSEQPLE